MQVYARFASLLPPKNQRQKEDLLQKIEALRSHVFHGVKHRYSALRAARHQAKNCTPRSHAVKDQSGGDHESVVDGPDSQGGRAGGRGRSRRGSAGLENTDVKVTDLKPSASYTTTSSPNFVSVTTKCFKCLGEGRQAARCPKHLNPSCCGMGHSIEICPNLEAVVMTHEEVHEEVET